MLDELVGYLDDEHMSELAGRLDGAIDEAQRGLQDTASSVRGFEDILASTQTLLGSGADASTGSLSATLAARQPETACARAPETSAAWAPPSTGPWTP